jgi:hypothetical protein
MLARSEVEQVEFIDDGRLIWNFPVIETKPKDDGWEAAIQPPPGFGDASVSQRYLLHTYREALLRRGDEQTLRKSLRPDFFRMPLRSKERPGDWNPDDPWPIPTEFEEARDVVEKLRELIVERDLASRKPARQSASKRLTKFLKELGIRAGSGRPSLPNSEQLVKLLMAECQLWLPVERSCQTCALERSARTALDAWGCADDPRLWAARLAFPTLTEREVRFLRSTKRPKDDRLTAACLIHSRMRDFLSFDTAADYALGTRAKEELLLDAPNPPCSDL